MPTENIDTNRTISADDANLFQSVQNAQAQVTDPFDGKPDSRFHYVDALKVLMPEYEPTNPNWLLTRLREDGNLRNDLTERLITSSLEEDTRFRSWWEGDDTTDDDRSRYKKRLDQTIIDDVSKHTYSGKSVRDSLVDHTFNLSKKSPEHGVPNPLSLMQKFPEDYERWFDRKDIKDNNVREDTVMSLYENDEGFRRQVIRDKLRDFEDALGNRANQGVYDPDRNPSEYAKAFAIFNRFGSEALTDYTNIQQHYVPDSPTQDTRVVSAFRRFTRSPQYKDTNPFTYARSFISGQRQLDFQPEDELFKYQPIIQQAADQYGLDPTLLAGLIEHESVEASRISGTDPALIRSPKDAVGLGQIMADTARENGLVVNDQTDDRLDPHKNIHASARILAGHLRDFEGNETMALAAYNAGPTAARRMQMRAKEQGTSDITKVLGEDYYAETARYIPRVKGNRDRFMQDKSHLGEQLTFTPKKEIDRLPRDHNRFTERMFYTPENKTKRSPQERTLEFVENILGWQSGDTYPEFAVGIQETTNIGELIEQGKPIDLEKAFEFYRRDNRTLPGYEHMVYDLIEQSMHDHPDEPNIDDILTTIMANASSHRENDLGEMVYQLDYRDLQDPDNQYLKILVDGLMIHGAGDEFLTRTGNTIEIEPSKGQRRDVARASRGLSGWLFKPETRAVMDDGGTITGFEKHIPNNFRNVAAGAVIGFTDIVPEAWGGIVGGWGEKFGELFTDDQDKLRWFHEQRNRTRDHYSGTLMEFTDPVIDAFGIPFSAVDIGTAGGTLVGYLAGINALGKGMVATTGKGFDLARNLGGAVHTANRFNQLSSIRKAENFKNFYNIAKRSRSQAAVQTRNTFEAIQKGWAYGTVPKFMIGSAGVETFTDPQYSLAAFADMLIGEAVLGLEGEDRWNLERSYRTTNSFGRWAMDWLGGEAIGILFDGLIGVGKFANDYSWRRLRGKPKLGLEYDHATGRYKPESESRYVDESLVPQMAGARKYLFPEVQRWVYNVRNNANNIPVGDIKESAARYARMRSPGPQFYDEGIEATQADIVAKFVADSNEFMGTVRQDLDDILRDANQKWGGSARLSDEQITQMRDDIYDQFMDEMASNVYSFVGDGSEFNSRSFAQQLEQHPAAFADVTPISVRGETDLTRTEAVIAQKQYPGAHVVPIGGDRFRVYQQDPALWRFDLAQRLRQYTETDKGFDSRVDIHVSRFGLDVSKEADLDDTARVIQALQDVEDVGFRHQGREGIIDGFDSRGWLVRWDDGTDTVYREIRGLDGVDTTPPAIRSRKAQASSDDATSKGVRFDEKGLEIEDSGVLRTSQTEEDLPILDLRSAEAISDDIRARQLAGRQQELEQVFADPDEQVRELLGDIRTLMAEGRHDEVEPLIREISRLRRGPEPRSADAIELPGVTDLRAIAEQDREAWQVWRASQEPTELDMVRQYHHDRLETSLRGGNLDTATDDIQMLRGSGYSKEAIDEMINENFAGDPATQQFLRNYNASIDFGEGVTDELIRARVDDSRLLNIRDKAFEDLPEQVRNQMVEQADMLAGMKNRDTPQQLIDEGDVEVNAFRSWDTANERFKEHRPNEENLSGREYAIRLAEDLGTDGTRSIAKLQKTRAGAKEKIPIRSLNEETIVGPNGEVLAIKNSQGLVVRVDPTDGTLPFYAMGRKNNIRGFPTRFVADQNGKISYNQEWTFINPNVTRGVDGRLKRFNVYRLPNGEFVYREQVNGKYLLNVQNPVEIGYFDYVGQLVRDATGRKQMIPGTRSDQLLTPKRVLGENVDAIQTRDPRTGRTLYKVVSPEDQVMLHGKATDSASDRRVPHVVFETHRQPIAPLEALSRMSKSDEGKLHVHAWVAVPGLIATGTVGLDENGELTPFARAALALGVLGMGGVMVRSMTGQLKIRKGYDRLSPDHKQIFDRMDWSAKVDEQGNFRNLTDNEQSMMNRLQKAGVPKDDFIMMGKVSSHGDIPEIRADVDHFRTDDYIDYSTSFDPETGQIHSTRLTDGPGEMDVIGVSLDERSTGLVSTHRPGHVFAEAPTETDIVGQHHAPIAWARIQTAPDGRLLVDELQIDNRLQQGYFGDVGDVNRDLYNTVLDDVVDRAIRESDGEFYITRGHLQADRYGDNPDTAALQSRSRDRLTKRVSELEDEQPSMVIREAQTFERAEEMSHLRDAVLSVVDEPGELADLVRRFREFDGEITERQLMGDLSSRLVRGDVMGEGSVFKVSEVENGYRLQLKNELLVRRAAKDIYNDDPLLRSMFPNAGDFYAFANRPNHTRGVQQFYDNTLPNIIRKRYGAEITPARGEGKAVFDSPEEAFHRVRVTQQGYDAAKGKTGKRINWETVGSAGGLAGLAAGAYAMEHIGRDPDQEGDAMQAGLGNLSMILMGAMALGMLSKRFRTKIGGNIKGKVDTKLKNITDNVSAKAIEWDGKKFDSRELYELDVAFNPRDPDSVTRNERMLRGVKMASKAGKNTLEWFRNSGYAQAGTQLLRKVAEGIRTATNSRGNTIADTIESFIVQTHQQPARIKAITNRIFNEDMGYGRGAFERFPSTEGVQKINGILDTPTDDVAAKKMFDDAVDRLLNRGVRVTGERGVAGAEIPLNVQRVYEGESGRLFRGIDDALLNDREAVDFVMALQRSYMEVNSEYNTLLSNEIQRRLLRLNDQPMDAEKYMVGDRVFTHDELVAMVNRWTGTSEAKTFREFVKGLNPDERHLMRIARKESDTFNEISKLQTTRSRFTDLRGRYHPQIVDHGKVNALRQRYVDHATANPDVMEGMSNPSPEAWARQQMMEEWMEINGVGDGRGLLGFDTEKLDVGSHFFDTGHDAQVKLMNIINETAPRQVQDQFDQYLRVSRGRVTPDVLEDLGFIQRTQADDGTQAFVLRQPEDFNPRIEGQDFTLFDIANRERFQEFYNAAMMDPAMKRSKFLENPRKFQLPMSWKVNDPLKAWNTYAHDVGPRLHALRHGVFEGKDFTTNYLEPLAMAMRNNDFTDAQITNTVVRTDEIFKNQFGIIQGLAGKSPQEAEQFLKTQRNTAAALRTWRNFDYMKRAYGFKYLNWFQTLISTMAMTSGRSMKQAFGIGDDALSYQGLRQFEDILKDANVIKEKDLAFRFDIQPADPQGTHRDIPSYLQNLSQKGADAISDFSFEKSALRLLGVDVGNTGRAFRMVTDSFHGTNVMNTGQNAFAFMSEAGHMARIAKEMREAGVTDGTFRASDGQDYNWSQVYQKLEDVGVSRTRNMIGVDEAGNRTRMSEADYFIQHENQMKSFIDRLKKNEKVSLNDFDSQYADIVENMWHFATESYHGTNQAMRPEKWNSHLGRTLSMYASFTYNIGMQITKRRILDPTDQWIQRYATREDGSSAIGRIQMTRLMKHIRSGDEEALRRLGVSNPRQAIAEFPIDAVDTMYRGMAGIGFSIATYTTLDLMRDVYAIPVKAFFGEEDDEQFRRTRDVLTRGIINPYAPDSQQVTLSDLFGGEADARDMVNLMTWGVGKLGQSSYGGMYLSPFDSMSKYGWRGIANMAPSTGIGDRFASDVVNMLRPIGTLNIDEMPPETLKFMINNMPVIGSNVFTESRMSARKTINDYQQSLREEE